MRVLLGFPTEEVPESRGLLRIIAEERPTVGSRAPVPLARENLQHRRKMRHPPCLAEENNNCNDGRDRVVKAPEDQDDNFLAVAQLALLVVMDDVRDCGPQKQSGHREQHRQQASRRPKVFPGQDVSDDCDGRQGRMTQILQWGIDLNHCHAYDQVHRPWWELRQLRTSASELTLVNRLHGFFRHQQRRLQLHSHLLSRHELQYDSALSAVHPHVFPFTERRLAFLSLHERCRHQRKAKFL
mmetsp:Transcript_21701/g.40871  ORF Transcript_21701/g.40871 Transcript_21701/m.40871 type:complete len:241 (-) Transcript_21701:159-881(-)